MPRTARIVIDDEEDRLSRNVPHGSGWISIRRWGERLFRQSGKAVERYLLH